MSNQDLSCWNVKCVMKIRGFRRKQVNVVEVACHEGGKGQMFDGVMKNMGQFGMGYKKRIEWLGSGVHFVVKMMRKT